MKCDNCRYKKMCVRRINPIGDMYSHTDNCEHYEAYEQRPHGECRTCKHFVRGRLDGKTYVCEHPDIELDDYFDYACITMDENDFCSRYEKKEGEKNEICKR
ncbi:MAG: hypothetical protein IIY21_09010 [Clostridiales bacterium]|nr:hypothetical protein [Clostridiales bacterium]